MAWNEPEYVCCKYSNKRLPFAIPPVWHMPEESYFCQIKIIGHHYKIRYRIQYVKIQS